MTPVEDFFPIKISRRYKSNDSLAHKLTQKDIVTDYLGFKITPESEHDIFYSTDPVLQEMIDRRENVRRFKCSKNIETLSAVALLHDTLEDTDTTFVELVNEFGVMIAYLVLEVTTNEEMKKILGKTVYLELEMKSMSSYALVIKLCDRLDNVGDLRNASPSFRVKYVRETLEILEYVSLNRNLSKTHLEIMRSIKDTVKGLIDEYDELKESEILNMIRLCYE